MDRPGMIPETRADGEKVQKGCLRICSTVALLDGSVYSILRNKSTKASLA
jgi:hypothetical protein